MANIYTVLVYVDAATGYQWQSNGPIKRGRLYYDDVSIFTICIVGLWTKKTYAAAARRLRRSSIIMPKTPVANQVIKDKKEKA